MVKKVQYKLIDTNTLPVEYINKSNAYEQFVGLDEKFTSGWIELSTFLSKVRQTLCNGLDLTATNRKAELYFSFVNQCGMLLIDNYELDSKCNKGT